VTVAPSGQETMSPQTTAIHDGDQFPQFSLVQGGLVYRFFKWTRLCNDDLQPTAKRIVVISLLAWLPLLLLSMFEGHSNDTVGIPFLNDLSAHLRFLVALPCLLAAESVAHEIMRPRIREFLGRHIVRDDDVPKLKAAVDSAHRMRDSVLIEAGLLALVYSFGLWIWSSQIASGTSSWYATPDGTHINLSLAGYWLVLVSVPLFQFFLLRWYVRFFIWFLFLLRVSRLDLNLVATHSDRSGGIGFLAQCVYGFSGVLFAQGTLLSATIAMSVINEGRSVYDFKKETVGSVLVFLAVVLGPLALFSRRMLQAKWNALLVYSSLASKYVEDFDRKWIRGGRDTQSEPLLGTGDIQSLADLTNSYAVLQSMRPVPFELRDALWLAAVTVAPLLPLAFFVFSAEELLRKLIQILI
jgi:hypothetical protein